MDSYEIIMTPDAADDLAELRDYIAYSLLVPETALSYIQAIRKEIEFLVSDIGDYILSCMNIPVRRSRLSGGN